MVGCSLTQHADASVAFVGKVGVVVDAVVGGWSVAIARAELELPRAYSLIPDSGLPIPEIQRPLGVDIPLVVERVGAIELDDGGSLLIG